MCPTACGASVSDGGCTVQAAPAAGAICVAAMVASSGSGFHTSRHSYHQLHATHMCCLCRSLRVTRRSWAWASLTSSTAMQPWWPGGLRRLLQCWQLCAQCSLWTGMGCCLYHMQLECFLTCPRCCSNHGTGPNLKALPHVLRSTDLPASTITVSSCN